MLFRSRKLLLTELVNERGPVVVVSADILKLTDASTGFAALTSALFSGAGVAVVVVLPAAVGAPSTVAGAGAAGAPPAAGGAAAGAGAAPSGPPSAAGAPPPDDGGDDGESSSLPPPIPSDDVRPSQALPPQLTTASRSCLIGSANQSIRKFHSSSK